MQSYSKKDIIEKQKEERIKTFKTTRNFRCFGCRGELIEHIADDCNFLIRSDCCCNCICKPDYIICHNHELYCISCHDDEEDYYICPKCNRYYMACPNCSDEEKVVLCQFLGHNGLTKQEEQIYCLDNIPIEILNYCKKIGEKTYQVCESNDKLNKFENDNHQLNYCVEDKIIFYFEVEGWLPTGYDGGMFHYWKCLECGTKYAPSDK